MSDRKSLGADAGANGKAKPVKVEALKEKDAAKGKDQNGAAGAKTTPKKRRKVNHACVYCRRSHMTCDLERPCTRCIKRNIGHLCHDQPRESDTKKPKPAKAGDEPDTPLSTTTSSSMPNAMGPPPTSASGSGYDSSNRQQRPSPNAFASGVMANANPMLVGPGGGTDLQGAMSNTGNVNQFAGFSDAWLTAQNFQDMNSFNNPNYMIGGEVTHEFNLLNDFLHSNILDDSAIAPDDSASANATNQNTPYGSRTQPDMLGNFGNNSAMGQASGGSSSMSGSGAMLPPPPTSSVQEGSSGGGGRTRSQKSGGGSSAQKDKTREYYLQAADPSGNDNAEERMSRVLKAKYDAGLLKPFNYINGYARLGKYLDGHIAASSKQKILRTINHFRPKFREKAQGLTDLQLLYVEMWFERQLMDYDRVFASMAVPACCWRRTGEIFRGNKEMAELINVPVDQLRDGKIALHEILTEESMVRYWEEFGTIAFDPAHDTLLTACSLKNPSDSSDHPILKCCFSFTIRRDEHKLPALIVGNFLPHDPPPQE
ncbi:Transcription factor [Lecanicillium sp. MT-2017a]|nr:Transcription factor [Lecanicillium sp. MT-2017a]